MDSTDTDSRDVTTRPGGMTANSMKLSGRGKRTYTIFEGTSEIQRLIISPAISGVHTQ